MLRLRVCVGVFKLFKSSSLQFMTHNGEGEKNWVFWHYNLVCYSMTAPQGKVMTARSLQFMFEPGNYLEYRMSYDTVGSDRLYRNIWTLKPQRQFGAGP